VILTSHVGTLPRPEQLDALCTRNEFPGDDAAFTSIVPGIVADVVRRQAELGLAIVNDGEFGKRGGFSYYAQNRLAGIDSRAPELTPGARDITARDALDFPGYLHGRDFGP
jgi:5-methyltetrahydropteroyltriglutamate--homocysteine methyltransferase